MKATGRVFFLIISSLTILLSLNTSALAKKIHHAHHQTTHHKSKPQKKTSTAVPSNIHGTAELVAQINQTINRVNPNLNVGIHIKSMRNSDTLYTRNTNHLYTPASILKVLTAEAALLYLGPEYKFPTVFVTDAGGINGGVLNGNLYLIHSGDPTLTYASLNDLMAGLRARQIQQINGNIYIDTSAYDQEVYGPGWLSNDTRFCYSAPISASIINHNCTLLQGGGRVTSRILHYNKYLIESLFQHYGIYISGNILPGVAPRKLPVIASHESKPLRDLISQMLKKSDNVIAGSLFKKIGELYSKRPGSWENGSSAVKNILREKAKLDPSRLNFLDGSGLSRENLMSPAQMMQVLDFAYHDGATSYDFIAALPIAGVDGTLKHRMQNIKWKVRAKTGSMSGVVALAGYVITREKEPMACVIIINGHMGMGWRYKDMENRIMTLLTNYSRS